MTEFYSKEGIVTAAEATAWCNEMRRRWDKAKKENILFSRWSMLTLFPKYRDLYSLHLKRAKHILHIAAAHHAEALILGAFGCGAFANDPNVVAMRSRIVLRMCSRWRRILRARSQIAGMRLWLG